MQNDERSKLIYSFVEYCITTKASGIITKYDLMNMYKEFIKKLPKLNHKYQFSVRCDDEYELMGYVNAPLNQSALHNIWQKARDYGKYLEPTPENYTKLVNEIKEMSGHVLD